MNNQLTINKDNILNAYQQATEEQKELLENMFGKDMFHPKDIRGRIKTFMDAYHILGDKNEFVRAYNNLIVSNCMSNDIIAYAKLIIIVEALNEGWKPTFNYDEYIYYPALYRYTKYEYDELTENQKKELIIVGKSNIKLNANGNIYAIEVCVSPYSISSIGNNIALKTSELAKYCGKQFIDIWAEFLFA